MSDPAVDAAQRAMKAVTGAAFKPNYDLIVAAREALKPIREKWEELLDPYATRLADPEATGAIKVLEALAPLIFSTEELER
ncbi:hypothetical protein R2325_16310 [Mycobacteroides chelonae]|jgi:hypothetical protein|uniref:hypothetical protein n=1 Tax=Mycobacteroides TaxID=670516 RepID=UPI0009268D86|nr:MULTISPECIES: hypothetical protein [Mycobacteroides]MBV6360417.1 hypothetical protein [Mycobacteroides chelonae]MEC4857138.1 hypothetical protein [Mycobacteroides chelonae]MEC4873548.1 hypothetical protein [Mycobacteroides chelonae]SHW93337.1 Uncharacterised protein [Mycobacteroides abscessus subsp. abscessus]SKL81405.1 Uncharacterised protein [Mycobacteroides abscessus subsp. abscessus]